MCLLTLHDNNLISCISGKWDWRGHGSQNTEAFKNMDSATDNNLKASVWNEYVYIR